jgi:hypothetical protein
LSGMPLKRIVSQLGGMGCDFKTMRGYLARCRDCRDF